MKPKTWRDRWLLQEDLNFLLTNRIPRHAMTVFVGWLSRIRSPALARVLIAVWRIFSDLDLSESPPQRYRSLRECFTRPLKPGMRPIDPRPDVVASPCDAIVGAHGRVVAGQVFQAKGFPYRVENLFGDAASGAAWEGGSFVTLRLTSSMYHRFHAPHDGRLTRVRYLSGDTWNVNPIALRRVQRLFCRNERAVLDITLDQGTRIALVPVAAILVASIRLHALDVTLHLRWKGPDVWDCDHRFRKGDELGWFEHGSTIIVFAPPGMRLAEGLVEGQTIRCGEPLMRLP